MSSDWSKIEPNPLLIDGYGILTFSAWAFHNKLKKNNTSYFVLLPFWSIAIGGVMTKILLIKFESKRGSCNKYEYALPPFFFFFSKGRES